MEVLAIYITANSFVLRMVRNIVGALVEIGTGYKKPSEMKRLLELRNRSLVNTNPAPAHGLYLVNVEY
jgi:tRNA pseudouridine38-40 synthase